MFKTNGSRDGSGFKISSIDFVFQGVIKDVRGIHGTWIVFKTTGHEFVTVHQGKVNMGTFEIILIAIGLAMDACAVSLAAAAAGFAKDTRAVFRLSFHFGLFQFMMPIIGWSLGVGFVSYFKAIDHWIAFFLLLFVGGRMIREGLDTKAENYKNDPSRGMTMVLLSVATSIDALAIGLSLALLDVTIWYPSVMIGLITSLMCVVAIIIGKRLGTIFGKRMEVFGGLVLIFIGGRILFSHLMA